MIKTIYTCLKTGVRTHISINTQHFHGSGCTHVDVAGKKVTRACYNMRPNMLVEGFRFKILRIQLSQAPPFRSTNHLSNLPALDTLPLHRSRIRRRKQRSLYKLLSLLFTITGMLLTLWIMVFSLFSKKASGMAASTSGSISLSTSASSGPISSADLERRLRGAL
jgi:hypothetical protein